jgi:hypothetical protein
MLAADTLRAIAALLFACVACATPAASAEFDPSIPEPRLLPTDPTDPATPAWRSRRVVQAETVQPSNVQRNSGEWKAVRRSTVQSNSQARQALPPQHRYPQQSRRYNTASRSNEVAYQPAPPRNVPPRNAPPPVRQDEPTFSGVAVWGDNAPVASSEPFVESEESYQSCGDDCGEPVCGDDCCENSDDDCDLIELELPFADRLWVRAEYLLWATPACSLPALVTTSPAGTARDIAGRLDQASTTTLLGNGAGLTSDIRSGARIELGYWLWPCQGLGFEASYIGLGSQSSQFGADSSSYSILARPFYNLQDGSQGADAALIVYPNVANGSISVSLTNQFQTADALLRRHLIQQNGRTIDFLAGYRYGYLQDNLSIDETTTSIDRQSPTPSGTTVRTLDQFDTKNRFNGGEVGIVFQQRYRRWSLDLLLKLAVGSTNSQVTINGSTAITPPGSGTTTYSGGLLALPTNIGSYEQNKLSLMPELGITLGYDVTRRLRATLGYTFLYWSNVARPGDQIDTDLNASQLPPGTLEGAAHPNFVFHTSDFWAQGMNVGLEYRF